MLSTYSSAQHQQASNPVSANSTHIPGVGSGYWTTAGAGLVLNISAGTAFCSAPRVSVSYAGGKLTLTASQINYVYLDPTASCVPAFNATGFTSGQVPIAIVLCSESAIVGVTDARHWSPPQPIGTTSSRQTVTKYLNGLRWADQFPGGTPTIQQSNALTDIGAVPGVIVDTPLLGSGPIPRTPNNVTIWDFRQTQDVLTGSSAPGMLRTPILNISQTLGDLTTVPLTGSITLTPGSKEVRGSGTLFTTQLEGGDSLGRSIKASSDASTCWTAIASVASDTLATLATNYPSTGCSGVSGGSAAYFATQLGLAITNLATAGTPNTPAGGESVGLSVFSSRTGGRRPLFGANINTSFQTIPVSNVPTDSTTASGIEIDFNNESPSDVTFPWTPLNSAIHVLSAGTKKTGSGISIYRSRNGVNEFGAGIWINQAWDTSNSKGAGIRLEGSKNHILLVPLTDDNSRMIQGKNSTESSTAWAIQANGGAFFGVNNGVGNNSVGFGTNAPNTNSRVHAYVAANSLQIPIRIENAQGGTGVAALGLGVANTNESSAFKAGIGLLRQASNGAGTLKLYNRITTDSGVDFMDSDAVFTASYMGALTLTAGGTNQPISLNPSGTAGVIAKGTGTDDSASAGSIGEYNSVSLARGSAITLTSGKTANVTSALLTAGDWDVTGVVDYTAGSSTSVTNERQGVTTTSATLGAQDTFTSVSTAAQVPGDSIDEANLIPVTRLSLIRTTTVYLVANATFTASSLKAYGTLRCRRIR